MLLFFSSLLIVAIGFFPHCFPHPTSLLRSTTPRIPGLPHPPTTHMPLLDSLHISPDCILPIYSLIPSLHLPPFVSSTASAQTSKTPTPPTYHNLIHSSSRLDSHSRPKRNATPSARNHSNIYPYIHNFSVSFSLSTVSHFLSLCF